jgi:hypothetical protein
MPSFQILAPSTWSPAIREAYESSKRRIPWVLQNPDKAEASAKKAAAEIAAARRALDGWKAKLGKLTPEQLKTEMPKFSRASREWYELASAFYMDSKEAPKGMDQGLSLAKQGGGALSSLVSSKGQGAKGQGGGFNLKSLFSGDEIGLAQIIVAGVILAVAAVAFAPAAFDLARSQRVRAETSSRELDARIAANAQGRTLQPSTELPPPSKGDGPGAGMILAVVGGVVVVGGGLFLVLRKG